MSVWYALRCPSLETNCTPQSYSRHSTRVQFKFRSLEAFMQGMAHPNMEGKKEAPTQCSICITFLCAPVLDELIFFKATPKPQSASILLALSGPHDSACFTCWGANHSQFSIPNYVST